MENATNKLQTFGYARMTSNGVTSVISEQINLNRQCIMTKDWEQVYFILGDALFKHLIKEYMIFLRTIDDSLVQISGTNIFTYLADKNGKLSNNWRQDDSGEVVVKVSDAALKTHKYNLSKPEDNYYTYKSSSGGKTWYDD